ncbi:MAG TPA: hypothetical protein VNJ54_14930 [Plantibacter sp.]|uniref:hypothetical protein n=1 Tax=unclassified Plantibacter TaxID=2624265 RepID=UPI002BA71ED3|nr:hypothetical protein [Plantibacter sp.]
MDAGRDAGVPEGEDAPRPVEPAASLEGVLRELGDEQGRAVAEPDDGGTRHVVEHAVVGGDLRESPGFRPVEARQVDAFQGAVTPDRE